MLSSFPCYFRDAELRVCHQCGSSPVTSYYVSTVCYSARPRAQSAIYPSPIKEKTPLQFVGIPRCLEQVVQILNSTENESKETQRNTGKYFRTGAREPPFTSDLNVGFCQLFVELSTGMRCCFPLTSQAFLPTAVHIDS